VKFDQHSDEFTVFEYDCPTGLIFDQRWEVCVWPGTTHEDPCYGSSEISPVPQTRFVCPTVEGYYADPENCRWFFACLDHARDGITPLTAYEFRCPFGLVFDEKNLLCQWPWLVDGCGNSGALSGAYFGSVAFGGARRGYIATAGGEQITGGRTTGTAYVTASDLVVHAGNGVTSGADRTVIQHGAGFAAGYEARDGASGILLTADDNAGSNVLSSSKQATAVNRGNAKQSGTSAPGEFFGQTANSYITSGRSSESFGNSGSYNEGRSVSSYASLPDSYVSGGRIENSGGFVLGEYVGVHGTATGSGIGSEGSAYVSGEEAASISTGSRNAAFIGSSGSGSGRALYSSNVAHGNEEVYSSGSGLSSVPVQTEVNIPNVPGLPVATLRKPDRAQIPIVNPNVVPLIAHQQGVAGISHTPISKSSIGVPVVQPVAVPVLQPAAVPVLQPAAVPVVQPAVTRVVQPATVPVVQPAAVRVVQPAVTRVVQPAAVPVVQPAAVRVVQPAVTRVVQPAVTRVVQPAVTRVVQPAVTRVVQPATVPVVQPAAVPIAQADPVTAYQQSVAENPQVPDVSVTTFRKAAVAKFPAVQPAIIPVAQTVPVTDYQETVVETPHASAVPITTFRRPAVAKIPAIQPHIVPLDQTVPVIPYQERVVETPQTPMVSVTTIRRPTVAKVPVIQSAVVPVTEAVPVTSYQERVAETSAATVPLAPVVPLVQNIVPVITHDGTTTVSKTSFVGTAPLKTCIQETPVVSAVLARNKLRPVPHQEAAVTVSTPAVPIINTYLSTPAPTVLPFQTQFSETGGSGFASGRDDGEVHYFKRRPAISVATNGAAGISVPNISPKIEIFGAVVTENSVPVTEIPVIRTGDSSGGHSFSTSDTGVITSGSVPSSPIQSHASTANAYSQPNLAILSGSSLPVTSVVRSGNYNGGYSYSTPASAFLTGEAISITPVPTVKSRVSSGSYSLVTHLPTEKFNAPSSEYSYKLPASTIASSDTVSVNAIPLVKPNVGAYSVPSAGTVPGDTVSVTNTRVTPVVGYSYPKPSGSFATGKAESFTGISLASGLEPAVFESSQRLASSLEIPSSTVGPTLLGSDVTRERYSTNAGGRTLNAPSTSNVQITNSHENGYDVPRTFISRGYALKQKALLSSTVEPIHSVSVADGDFGVRKSFQHGETVASYHTGEARERFTPQVNLTYGAPLVTVHTAAQGQRRPYLSSVSGYVSSTPVPVTLTSGPRSDYSHNPRSKLVSSTSIPVAYTAQIIPESEVVSTPAPVVTRPAVPFIGVTSVPVLQSTSSDRQIPEEFGSRIGQSASRRKPASKPGISYDKEHVEALLAKFSGKFGGLLDNNKESFISGVISGGHVDHDIGGIVENGRGGASHRGRVDGVALSGLKGVHSSIDYNDRSSTVLSGTRAGFSSTPETIGTSTLVNEKYISATPSTNTEGSRGKIKYGSKVNTDTNGGYGYEAITIGHEASKLRSKQPPAVFITRLSDVNPLLIAKLGAQCTCKSNTVTLKRPDGFSNDGTSRNKLAQVSSAIFDDDITSRSGTYNIPEHIPLAPLPGSNIVTGSSPDIILGLNEGIPSTSERLTLVPLSTPRTTEFLKTSGVDEVNVTPASTVLLTTLTPHTKLTADAYKPARTVNNRFPISSTTDVRLRTGSHVVSTVPTPITKDSTMISSATGFRYRARPQAPNVVSTTAIPVAVPGIPGSGKVKAVSGGYPEAGSFGSGTDVVGSTRGPGVRRDGSVPEAGSDATARAGIGAGRAFDRYGPGGWRGLDETLQGSIDCQRAGLFRHPKYCNKFYACYWDEWKGRYTLHVFNCPVHLAYDSNLGACNWPSKGPGCSDDNLLV
jgi:hypothetical protein